MMSIPAFINLIAFLLIASPITYLGGHLGKKIGLSTLPQKLALTAFLITWLPFYDSIREFRIHGPMTYTVAGVPLAFDGLSLLLTVVVLLLGTLVTIFSGPYMAKQTGRGKYYAMLLVMVGVIIGLGSAADLFNLWIWFEAMAVSSYLLVAFYRNQSLSLEAGFKYLIQSATGSVLVLVGIGFVFAQTGTMRFDEIQSIDTSSSIMLAAGAFFVFGFGIKAALVPLHTWLPDAHSQAPSGISAMLSGIVIEAGLIAMLRSLGIITPTTINWGVVLMTIGAINMLVGNLMALKQTQVKRLLAYSSLTHEGYMLLGLGIAVYAREANGAEGGLFHLFNHGLMKGLAFLAAGTLLYALHIATGEHGTLTTRDLSGAARRYPWATLALSVALLGLGGLPPLAGFMSKWQIFTAGFQAHNVFISFLIVFAALNSVLSLAYYLPIVNTLYRQKPSSLVQSGYPLPLSMNITLAALAVVIVIIGIRPSILNWLIGPAGAAFMAVFGG